ncbi:MAG TPA: MarR family transcriptional regulator [Anaerolineaceae bacterium]
MSESEHIAIGRLIAMVSRLHASRTDRLMECIGLFRGQAILLIILSHEDGQTHSALADRLEITPAAVTKVIKRLEKMNYLERRSDPTDERISRVFLKADGWAIIHQIYAIFRQRDACVLKGFTPEEEQMLDQLLRRVYSNLSEESCEPL